MILLGFHSNLYPLISQKYLNFKIVVIRRHKISPSNDIEFHFELFVLNAIVSDDKRHAI